MRCQPRVTCIRDQLGHKEVGILSVVGIYNVVIREVLKLCIESFRTYVKEEKAH